MQLPRSAKVKDIPLRKADFSATSRLHVDENAKRGKHNTTNASNQHGPNQQNANKVNKTPARSSRYPQGRTSPSRSGWERNIYMYRLDGKKFRLSLVPARSAFSPHSHNYTQKVAITNSRQGQTHVSSRTLRLGVNTVPSTSLVFTRFSSSNTFSNEEKWRCDAHGCKRSQNITKAVGFHAEK